MFDPATLSYHARMGGASPGLHVPTQLMAKRLWSAVPILVALSVFGCKKPREGGGTETVPYTGPPGSLAPYFGLGGVVTADPSSGSDTITALAWDGTSLLIAGADESAGSGDLRWRVEKRNWASGAPDSLFGTGGVITSDPSTGPDVIHGLAIDSTYLYAVGYDCSSGNRRWRIEKRRILDGTPDLGFGSAGVVAVDPSTGSDEATGIILDATSMYIIGFDEAVAAGDSRWRIEKRSLTDGSLDPVFGLGGVLTTNPSTGVDQPRAIIGGGYRLWVAGFDASPGNRQWRVEMRTGSDGSLDSAFGTGGVVNSNPSTGNDEVTTLATGPAYTGIPSPPVLYVGGTDEALSAGDSRWRLETRRSTDGVLQTGFGTSGVLTVNPSSGRDDLSCIALARYPVDAIVLIGADSSPNPSIGDRQWRTEMRWATSGVVVASYGRAGVVTSDPSPGDDVPRVTLAGIITGGVDLGSGNRRWRIEGRLQ